jgi:hypothetical protein
MSSGWPILEAARTKRLRNRVMLAMAYDAGLRRQEILLTEEESATVDDGVAVMEKLLDRLSDVPTPDGGIPPRQRGLRPLPVSPP